MSGTSRTLLLIFCWLWPPVTGFLMQRISQCTFSDNKQGNITFGTGFTFNRQILLSYSKSDQMYIPCPMGCIREVGQVVVQFSTLLNTNPDTVTRVEKEEEKCKKEVITFWEKTVKRTAKPSVEVFLPVQIHTESDPVLICHVWGFYPQDIRVAWFKNDHLVKNYTEPQRSGDWTYRVVAVLDLRDTVSSDNYTCLVDHSSLDEPILKIWKHGLTDIQIINISVASVVFVLGVICLILGVACWKNAKRSGYFPIPGSYED
ncbi:HLA class II histocompatibility antigen, DM beta chain [Pyxicephalus adspersus]